SKILHFLFVLPYSPVLFQYLMFLGFRKFFPLEKQSIERLKIDSARIKYYSSDTSPFLFFAPNFVHMKIIILYTNKIPKIPKKIRKSDLDSPSTNAHPI